MDIRRALAPSLQESHRFVLLFIGEAGCLEHSLGSPCSSVPDRHESPKMGADKATNTMDAEKKKCQLVQI